MVYYHKNKTDVLEELSSREDIGLSSAVVEERLGTYGPNTLREKKKKTNIQRFFDQFKDVMILILLLAAIISFRVACVEGELREFFEPALILLIVILKGKLLEILYL